MNLARLSSTLAWQAGALLASTAVIAALELAFGVHETSAVYLLAVAVVAIRRGTLAAITTAAFAFLLYNFLFVDPRLTLLVASSESIITLLLLLALGVVIGRLAGAQHDRAVEADRSAREARLLSGISAQLAGAKRTQDALPALGLALADALQLERLWIELVTAPSRQAVVADTGRGQPVPTATSYWAVRPGGSGWIRLANPAPAHGALQRHKVDSEGSARHRVEFSDGVEAAGSIWFLRAADLGRPSEGETRLLGAAAEQIGQGIRRDRLAEQANDREIALRSDELKSALLDSVSHDLRTPLASIRATAGNLADPDMEWEDELRREAARQIDREADRLSRLVGGLLDLSRIKGGALRPELELIPPEELVHDVLAREASRLGDRRVDVQIAPNAPWLNVDPMFADQILTNLVENTVLHTPAEAPIRITVSRSVGSAVIIVEDGGPGVPASELPHLFDPFVTGSRPTASVDHGAGLGLAVVRGLCEGMGGTVLARSSELGGLAVEVQLPATPRQPGSLGA
jgi:two-component system, OmpR family, sensor histidine kinase KdpD